METSGPAKASALPWAGVWVMLAVVAALVNSGMVYASGGVRGYFLPALAGAVCVLAALFDGFTRRIPNQITYAAVVAGVALNALVPVLNGMHAQASITWLGAVGPRESLLGLLVCGVLAVAANLLAGIHGGDLKLLAAIGAMLGLSLSGGATLLALGIALVYAVLNLAMFGRLNKVLQIGSQRALELFFLRRFETPMAEEAGAGVSHIPMAIPMALGIVVMLGLQLSYGSGGLW